MSLDPKALLAEAEESGKLYRIKGSWKGLFIFGGVLCCLLILLIPLGIWMFIIASKGRVGITDQGFAVRWFTHKAYAWDEIESFQRANMNLHVAGGGLVGGLIGAAATAAVSAKTEGLKGPLQFRIKGKRGLKGIVAHAIENSVEMAQLMEKHTGLEIFPPPPEEESDAEKSEEATA